MELWKAIIGGGAALLFAAIILATIVLKDFRRLLVMFLILLAALAMTSCATVQADTCVPTGYPTIDASWTIMEERDVEIPDGRVVRVTGYRKNGRDIVVITMDGVLVVVDFAPLNPNVPVWANERYFDPATRQIRPAPIEGPCRWFQPIVGERA